MHCFDDVRAILFIVNLAGYDQVLFEDTAKNRMLEELELFEQVSQDDRTIDGRRCSAAWPGCRAAPLPLPAQTRRGTMGRADVSGDRHSVVLSGACSNFCPAADRWRLLAFPLFRSRTT